MKIKSKLIWQKQKPQLCIGLPSNFRFKHKHYLFIDLDNKIAISQLKIIKLKLKLLHYSRYLLVSSGRGYWLLSFKPDSFTRTAAAYSKIPFKDEKHYNIGIKDKEWIIRISSKYKKPIKIISTTADNFDRTYDYAAELQFRQIIIKMQQV